MEKQVHSPAIIVRVTKSIIVLFMCVALVFMSSYKKPVKAEAALTTAATVTGIVVVAAALTALGVGVAAKMGHSEYEQHLQNIWNNLSTDIKNQITLTGLSVSEGLATVALTEAQLSAIFRGAQTEFPQISQYEHDATFSSGDSTLALNNLNTYLSKFYGTNIQIDSITFGGHAELLHNVKIVGIVTASSIPAPFTGISSWKIGNYVSIGLKTDSTWSPSNYTINGQTVSKYHWNIDLSNTILPNGNGITGSSVPADSKWGVFEGTMTTQTALYFVNLDYVLDKIMSASWQIGLEPEIPVYGQDVFNPADNDLYAEGDSVMTKSIDEVINDIEKRLEKDGYIPLTVPADSDIDDQRTRTQADTTGKDIATDADRTADDTYNDTNDKDTTQPKTSSMPDATIPQAITKKFPFSIPWDLYNSISNLVAVGKAPVFDIPVNFTALNYHSSIHLDMATFNPIALIFRWGLSLLFILALIILTGRVIKH